MISKFLLLCQSVDFLWCAVGGRSNVFENVENRRKQINLDVPQGSRLLCVTLVLLFCARSLIRIKLQSIYKSRHNYTSGISLLGFTFA